MLKIEIAIAPEDSVTERMNHLLFSCSLIFSDLHGPSSRSCCRMTGQLLWAQYPKNYSLGFKGNHRHHWCVFLLTETGPPLAWGLNYPSASKTNHSASELREGWECPVYDPIKHWWSWQAPDRLQKVGALLRFPWLTLLKPSFEYHMQHQGCNVYEAIWASLPLTSGDGHNPCMLYQKPGKQGWACAVLCLRSQLNHHPFKPSPSESDRRIFLIAPSKPWILGFLPSGAQVPNSPTFLPWLLFQAFPSPMNCILLYNWANLCLSSGSSAQSKSFWCNMKCMCGSPQVSTQNWVRMVAVNLVYVLHRVLGGNEILPLLGLSGCRNHWRLLSSWSDFFQCYWAVWIITIAGFSSRHILSAVLFGVALPPCPQKKNTPWAILQKGRWKMCYLVAPCECLGAV